MNRNNLFLIIRARFSPDISAHRHNQIKNAALCVALFAAALPVAFFSLGVLQLPAGWTPFAIADNSSTLTATEQRGAPAGPQLDIASLFDDDFFYQASPPVSFDRNTSVGPVTVATTIVPDIQKHLIEVFERSTPLLAAGVVIDADTGAVLAMGNYASPEARTLLPGAGKNYCLYAGFPAASLIKIVTAAAVLEHKGFDPARSLPVSGGYHTLYKHQLGLKRAKYRPEPISLEKAFAFSVNPFFGQLGIRYLQPHDFVDMAESFCFNVPLAFDLPLWQSSIFDPANDFQRAELSSGFNTRTTISPLHAALIAGLALNSGEIMRPFLVSSIFDDSGQVLYHKRPEVLSRPLGRRSVDDLGRLMRATVRYGTARKSFAPLKRLRSYRSWKIGGKTGAINLAGGNHRCEWFAGFAGSAGAGIAISCVVVHGDLRSAPPSTLAAEIVRTVMKNPSTIFAKHRQPEFKSAASRTTPVPEGPHSSSG